jgi:hypothetical protein
MPAKKATTKTTTANGQPATKFYEVNPKDLVSVNSRNKNKNNEEFYQPRHDKPDINDNWVANIKENGVIHPPVIMIKNGTKFLAAGTRRSLGASKAGLKSITIMEIPYDLAKLRRIQSAENEQRKANTVFDTIHNVMQFLQLDKQGKPQGLSFAQTGSQFGKSHQWARDMALISQNAPKWILDAVEDKKIHLTLCFKLVGANVKAGGTEKDLKAAYDKATENTTTSSTGNPRQTGGVHNTNKPKRVNPELVEAWATNPLCPEAIRTVLQAQLGLISIEDARKLARGKFDKWMFLTLKDAKKALEPVEEGKGKGKGKVKEEEIEEEDLDEEDDEDIEEDDDLEEDYDEEDSDEEDDEQDLDEDDDDEDEEDDEEAEDYDEDDEEDDLDGDDEEEEEEEEVRPGVGGRRRAPAPARARSRR